MLEKLKKALEAILDSKIKDRVVSSEFFKDELVLTVDAKAIEQTLTYLKNDKALLFKQLISICGVDYPEKEMRFEVVYCLLSMEKNIRIKVKVLADENTIVPSISDLFQAALWYEREVWDMYGVKFSGNPDLRRILTDYGFEGHPLRKDFPLTGHLEVRYDTELKKVVYEPVTLTQDFRKFDFSSPWEGTNYNLPGDEKASK